MINVQGQGLLGFLMASMQILASPSKTTWFHFSILANCIAQSRASVLAWSGVVNLMDLAQTFIGTPRWFLATMAIAAELFDVAASTFNLIVPRGGDHFC